MLSLSLSTVHLYAHTFLRIRVAAILHGHVDTEGYDTARNFLTRNILKRYDMEHLEHDTNLVPRSGTKNARAIFQKRTSLEHAR